MRSQLWFDPQSVGGFTCLYSEAPAVSFLTSVSGHCRPGELEDQGRWGRAGRGRWSPITTTVQPPSQDTSFPQQQSAVASLNGKTARCHEFINGWFSGAGRAHWVSCKASQIRLANGPAIPLGPWGTLEAASGPPSPASQEDLHQSGRGMYGKVSWSSEKNCQRKSCRWRKCQRKGRSGVCHVFHAACLVTISTFGGNRLLPAVCLSCFTVPIWLSMGMVCYMMPEILSLKIIENYR